jgi:DNA-binding beta-propeller fold protein YncE
MRTMPTCPRVRKTFMVATIACAAGCALTHSPAREAAAEPGPNEHVDADGDAAAGLASPDAQDAAALVPPDPSDSGSRDAGRADAEAETDVLFVPALDRVDAVHDSKRGTVYISTRHGEVLAYDIAAQRMVRSIAVGGQPSGLDLSPSEDLLLVADMRGDREQLIGRVHVVDLTTRMIRTVAVDIQNSEFGFLTGVFLDEARILVTSRGQSGAMRLVQLDDGNVETLRRTTGETTLAISADRSVVAYAEAGLSGGPFGRFDVATGEFATGMAGGNVYDVAISPDTLRLVVLKQSDALFFDEALEPDGEIDRLTDLQQPRITGVAWSPVADRIYLSSAGDGISTIEEVDATSLTRIAFIDTEHSIRWHGNHALEHGRLRISRDGRVLLATVDGGVTIYRLDPP